MFLFSVQVCLNPWTVLRQPDLQRYLFLGGKGMFLCFYVKNCACWHCLSSGKIVVVKHPAPHPLTNGQLFSLGSRVCTYILLNPSVFAPHKLSHPLSHVSSSCSHATMSYKPTSSRKTWTLIFAAEGHHSFEHVTFAGDNVTIRVDAHAVSRLQSCELISQCSTLGVD